MVSNDKLQVSSKTLYSLLFSIHCRLAATQDTATFKKRRNSSDTDSERKTNTQILLALKKTFPEFALSDQTQRHRVLSNLDVSKTGYLAKCRLVESFYGLQHGINASHLDLALRLQMKGTQPFQDYRLSSASSFIEHVRRLNGLTDSKPGLNKLTETNFFSVAPLKKPSKSSTDTEKAWLALWQHAYELRQQKDQTSQAKATTLMDCMLNIQYVRPTLCQHREKWKPIVANVALCLLGGFVLYGVGILLRHAWQQRNPTPKDSAPHHTLPFWATTSEKRLNAVQAAVSA